LTVCGGQSFLVVWRVQYGSLECFMAAMSKIARRKTVGLLGGDLALNAEQAAGGYVFERLKGGV